MFGNRKKAIGGAEKLAGVPFFAGFSPDELQRVAELADDVDAEPGAVLVEQGRVGQECYVILDGQAGVYVGGEHVTSSGPGSMVGEMALLEHKPRNATVIAETPMKLIVFDTQHFKQLLSEMPKVNDRVMEMLAARLRPAELTADRSSAGDRDGPVGREAGGAPDCR